MNDECMVPKDMNRVSDLGERVWIFNSDHGTP